MNIWEALVMNIGFLTVLMGYVTHNWFAVATGAVFAIAGAILLTIKEESE